MRIIQIASRIDGIVEGLISRFPGLDLEVREGEFGIYLDRIEVPDGMRGQGFGSEVVKVLQDYARQNGQIIFVHPSAQRGRRSDLHRFYERAGFRPIPRSQRYSPESPLFSPAAEYLFWRPT